GEAGLLGFRKRSMRGRGTWFRHRIFPVARSIPITKSLSPSNPVTKIRLRPSTGDECPAGREVFQRTLRSGPNSRGRFTAPEIPVPFGPRNWDQSSDKEALRG